MSDKSIYAVNKAKGLKLFRVARFDVYRTEVLIRAESEGEALQFVKLGQGRYGDPVHHCDDENRCWEVTCDDDGEGEGEGQP